MVRVIRDADEATVEDAVLRLSRTHRLLAPLAVAVGAFVMLFKGLKLLVSNWRLTLVQVLPAIWIWLAMIDLKAHALHGRSFTVISGPLLVAAMLLITAITAASFFLNAVFAFAIDAPGAPDIGHAKVLAWKHRRVVLSWGTGVGVLLAFAAVVVGRWGTRWFSLCLGVVVGVMMVCYVAVPSRLIGVKKTALPRRERVHGRGRRRRHRRRGLRPGLRARPDRAPHARIVGAPDPRRGAPRDRAHARGRRDELG